MIQIDDFAKAIAHAISQIFSILEHLLFFESWAFLEWIFAKNISGLALETFFACFFFCMIFDPNSRFSKGYSPCFIANFFYFGTLVIFSLLGVLGVDFCVKHFCCGSRDVLLKFFKISIFDPN